LKIKLLKFDSILIPDLELTSARLISAFTQAGIHPIFLGGDGWGNNGEEFTGILKNDSFTGYSISHWSSDLKSKASAQFALLYEKRFGIKPNDTSVLAFDSMNFLIQSILKAKALTREGVEDSMNAQKTFEGVTGTFKFTANKAPQKSVILLKTTSGGQSKTFEVIRPQGGLL
jgi:branched-chain amino acid transport system substrate-binding protein